MIPSLPKEVYLCLDCGTCTSLCKVAYLLNSNPRLFKWRTKEELQSQLYKCTLCGRCKEGCPRGVDTKHLFLSLREYLFHEGLLPKGLKLMSEAVEREKNVADFPNVERSMWADFLPEPLEEKERAEVLYFVGCMSSFSPAIQQIPQSVATLLQRVGIDFMIMGEEEYCCGYPLLVGGMKEKISFLIEHNCKQIMDRGIKKIIFSCPSCYYTFSKFYPLQDIQLLHYVEYLLQLLDEGRLPLSSINKVVTYHDPCDLGRGLGIYDAPRALIEAIPGLDFVEMPKSKEMALCCGGGGDLEIVDQPLSQKIGYTVIEEAKKVRVQALITACQQCKRTLQKAAEGIEVIDISELILLSLEGEDGDKRM